MMRELWCGKDEAHGEHRHLDSARPCRGVTVMEAAVMSVTLMDSFDYASSGWNREDAARVPLTQEQIVGARYVRDEFGWHEVVRVNAKTVTVATAYSWTNRIPVDRVIAARA